MIHMENLSGNPATVEIRSHIRSAFDAAKVNVISSLTSSRMDDQI